MHRRQHALLRFLRVQCQMDEQVNGRPVQEASIAPTAEKGTEARGPQGNAPVGSSRVWASGLWLIPLGWELAVPIAAGAVLGHWLDSRYQSGPAWTFFLLLVGAAAGFYNVLKLIQRAAQRDRHRADSE